MVKTSNNKVAVVVPEVADLKGKNEKGLKRLDNQQTLLELEVVFDGPYRAGSKVYIPSSTVYAHLSLIWEIQGKRFLLIDAASVMAAEEIFKVPSRPEPTPDFDFLDPEKNIW